MSLQTREIRLGDAFDDLDQELDELAAKLREAEAGTASAATLDELASQTERALSGVSFLVYGDEDVGFAGYGEDATVTIGGLDAGDYARVDDRAAAISEQSDDPGGNPGSRATVYAAVALVDAPFLPAPDDVDESDPLNIKMAAIAEQPVGVRDWLQSQANDLTTVSDDHFRPLRERLADTAEADTAEEA
jgi:hypothetical protein